MGDFSSPDQELHHIVYSTPTPNIRLSRPRIMKIIIVLIALVAPAYSAQITCLQNTCKAGEACPTDKFCTGDYCYTVRVKSAGTFKVDSGTLTDAEKKKHTDELANLANMVNVGCYTKTDTKVQPLTLSEFPITAGTGYAICKAVTPKSMSNTLPNNGPTISISGGTYYIETCTKEKCNNEKLTQGCSGVQAMVASWSLLLVLGTAVVFAKN